MATLHRHHGLVSIHLRDRGLTRLTRYAIAGDGTVLWYHAGWKLSKLPRATVEALPRDESPAAKAILTRANADAHAHDQAVRTRRITRRTPR